MICRRRGSATALKASDVVAARATQRIIYTHIGIFQPTCIPSTKPACRSSSPERLLRLSGGWPAIRLHEARDEVAIHSDHR